MKISAMAVACLPDRKLAINAINATGSQDVYALRETSDDYDFDVKNSGLDHCYWIYNSKFNTQNSTPPLCWLGPTPSRKLLTKLDI